MPTEAEHLKKAVSNETFAESLDRSVQPNVEWAITALFYSAVHRVEAHFAKTVGFHSRDHEDRKRAMAKYAATKRCFGEYAHLETMSKTCRYRVCTFTQKDYDQTAKPRLEDLKKIL